MHERPDDIPIGVCMRLCHTSDRRRGEADLRQGTLRSVEQMIYQVKG